MDDLLFAAASLSPSDPQPGPRRGQETYQHPTQAQSELEQMRAQQATIAAAEERLLASRLEAQARVDAGDTPPVWGSFERNTGTWCPYPGGEAIEAAYARGDASIFLPQCFNATVHFERRPGHHHYQKTPAVGSKPVGFRSVARAPAGERMVLHWWADTRMWRLEQPSPPGQTQTVTVYEVDQQATAAPALWQWCDLVGDAIGNAKEINWHAYSDEVSAQIEAAWQARAPTVSIVIGITTYHITDFSGAYAVQKNQASGGTRMVRRYQSGLAPPPPKQLAPADASALQGESCALCTEEFEATPQWPVRRTPCGHAFHHTCLQHLLVMELSRRKCPLCRAPLPDARGNASPLPSPASAGGGGGGMSYMEYRGMYG